MRTGSSSNRSSAPAGKRWRQNAGRPGRMGDGSAAPIGGRVLVQELQCEIQYELIERLGFETSEPLAECRFGNDGLRHGAVAARTADLAEVLPDELAGVSRVAKIPDGNHERLAHDPRHDRPLDVFQLQKEVGNVRDEVFPGRLAEEC